MSDASNRTERSPRANARTGVTGRSLRRRALALGIVGVVVLGACSESANKKATNGNPPPSVLPGVSDCDGASSIIACAPKNSMLTKYLPDAPKEATGTPITLGVINQDTGAAGAFPELTLAVKTAVKFINTELNGVDGHPIELVTCNTNFSPDLSQSCAQEMVAKKATAVVGGIDIWGTGITTLENNKIPYVGGIPVSFEAARSSVSFQFSGGLWGAVLGMGKYAMTDLKAKKIAIIYGDFGPIKDAAELGKKVFEKQGAEVTLIPTSSVNADMVTAINQTAQASPDAVIALTADSGCKPTMVTAKQLNLQAPVMYTGACASPNIVNSVGDAAEGAIFNLEADLDPKNSDNVVYQSIAKRYGPEFGYEAQGAGTVSFRAMMNLYAVMRDLGGDNVSSPAILKAFRQARDQPSFFGHPYTCDKKQLEGYDAMCSPQQTLGVLKKGTISQLTDWIEVGGPKA